MKIHQILVRSQFDNQAAYQPLAEFRPDLLLVFGSPEALQSGVLALQKKIEEYYRAGVRVSGPQRPTPDILQQLNDNVQRARKA